MSPWYLSIMLLVLATPAVAELAERTAGAPGEPFAELVAPADSLPYLKFFADGKTSLNERCPVRKVKLNPKMGASYVNDQPVGFC